MIPVDSGIPIPPSRRGRPGMMYPWLTMNIGDSFFLANRGADTFGSMACNAGKRYGLIFTVRKVDGGIRVWRTA